MDPFTYVFVLQNGLTFENLHFLFQMAVYAVEGIHGRSAIAQSENYWIEDDGRICVIDASTSAGIDMARILNGILAGVLGEDGISVEMNSWGVS